MTAAADRQARLDALTARLRPVAEAAARRMAEELVDRPDAQLFGAVEFALRDAAHDLAAAAHQTGLEARKKGATTAPPATALIATPTPGSSRTDPAPS